MMLISAMSSSIGRTLAARISAGRIWMGRNSAGPFSAMRTSTVWT
jgi:hypothetical protein